MMQEGSPSIGNARPLHDATGSDHAWLDAQYNPIPLVDDAPGLFGKWTAESAETRKSVACMLDIPYGSAQAANALETLDVFPAARRNGSLPSPVLVFVHGGYWRGSDKSQYSFLAAPFVNAGITVVMPNYPLCPSTTIPGIALSLVKAMTWVHEHIADHGGDPARVSVFGHSAGGHLSAMLVSCHWKKVDPSMPDDFVRKALAISGLFELEPFRHAPFLAATLGLTEEAVMEASPARFPPPSNGATLYAVVGGDEPQEFQRQNALIRERWGAEAVPVCEPIPGRGHFTILPDLLDPASRLHQLTMQMVGGVGPVT